MEAAGKAWLAQWASWRPDAVPLGSWSSVAIGLSRGIFGFLALAAFLGIAAIAFTNSRKAYPVVLHGVGNLQVITSRRRLTNGTRDHDQTRTQEGGKNPAERIDTPTRSLLGIGKCPSISSDSLVPGGLAGGESQSDVPVWSWREYLNAMCPAMFQSYSVSPALFNAHLQTQYAAFAPSIAAVDYVRDLLPLPDGGEIAIDWSRPLARPYRLDTPTVVILPGLTGGSHENYVKELVHFLNSEPYGYRCVIVNFRGCAQSVLQTPQLYNGAYTEDLRFAMKHLRRIIPKSKIAALGFSLGSNVLVKYIGEEGDKVPFCGAVSVCNPFDFALCSKELHSTMVKRMYSQVLANNLKAKVYRQHVKVLSQHPRLQHARVLGAKTIWEWDDRVTRLMFNYLTVEDYYADASSCNYISRVRVPLLCLNDVDDPISAISAVPFAAAAANPWVLIGTTKGGGHMGHFTGFPPRRYTTAVYGQFLAAVLQAGAIIGPMDLGPDPSAEELIDEEIEVTAIGHQELRALAPERIPNGEIKRLSSSTQSPPDIPESRRLAPLSASEDVNAPPRAVVRSNPRSTAERLLPALKWLLPMIRRWLEEHATTSRLFAFVLFLLGARSLTKGRPLG